MREENLNDKYIKAQGHCGSCWAIAETTALSYRYFKQTKTEVNLTGQYPLSSFLPSCEEGPNSGNADSFLDLVKNGTVTEECFNYNSGNGKIVDNCPLFCRDGSELKKYYAKNIYKLPEVSQDNYYDIVETILYQLYNFGPLNAVLLIDKDFDIFGDKVNCGDYIFIHDEAYDNPEGHWVVIVGYGYSDLESKYFWIVQNSWGKDFCDLGIIKIEFGQVNIENNITLIDI